MGLLIYTCRTVWNVVWSNNYSGQQNQVLATWDMAYAFFTRVMFLETMSCLNVTVTRLTDLKIKRDGIYGYDGFPGKIL